MSYRFFPARQENFYPPQVPYFAGIGGMHGLGDYAGDLANYRAAKAAYDVDYVRWQAEKAAYDVAYANWQRAVKVIDADYSARGAAYSQNLQAYNNAFMAWQAAAGAWDRTKAAAYANNIEKAKQIASAYGFGLPQSFINAGACLTQAQRDAYARNCQTVKGLGSADPDCGWKQMPLCPNLGPRPVEPIRPVQPVKPAYSAAPSLRPEPVKPVEPVNTGGGGGTATPGGGGGGGSSIPVIDSGGGDTDDDTKKAGLIQNGLILLAIAGGGYLVYRTLKKPKAA